MSAVCRFCFFFQAEDGIRDIGVTGVQTCALPICNYGLVKALIESRFPVLGSKFELIFNRQTPIKIAYANIVLIFMYIEAKYMIGFVLPDKPLYILAFLVLYQIGFLSFDYIMTEAIAYYHNKIKKDRKSTRLNSSHA